MSDQLRAQVVRLAHANPELRPHLLPLLVDKVAGAQGTYNTDVGFVLRADINKVSPGAAGYYLWYIEGTLSMQNKKTGERNSWPIRVNVGKGGHLSNLPVELGTSSVRALGEMLEAQVQAFAKESVLDAVQGLPTP